MFFLQEIADSSKPDSVMESTTDAAEWKLEVERVLPLLKVHIRTDNKVHFLKFLQNSFRIIVKMVFGSAGLGFWLYLRHMYSVN